MTRSIFTRNALAKIVTHAILAVTINVWLGAQESEYKWHYSNREASVDAPKKILHPLIAWTGDNIIDIKWYLGDTKWRLKTRISVNQDNDNITMNADKMIRYSVEDEPPKLNLADTGYIQEYPIGNELTLRCGLDYFHVVGVDSDFRFKYWPDGAINTENDGRIKSFGKFAYNQKKSILACGMTLYRDSRIVRIKLVNGVPRKWEIDGDIYINNIGQKKPQGGFWDLSQLTFTGDNSLYVLNKYIGEGKPRPHHIIVNAETGVVLWVSEDIGISCVALSPKEDRIAVVCGNNTIKLFDWPQWAKK